MSPATGFEFCLLPSDNATGNFTKIVQRVRVKIVIDGPADLKDLLRPGMSVEAEIMTTRAIDARTEKSNVFHHCHCCFSCSGAKTIDAPGASFMTWLAVIGGCLGAFLAILNIQVAGSSLADVSGALGTGSTRTIGSPPPISSPKSSSSR